MTKKIITILACLFFTLAPRQVSAMNKEYSNIFATLIDEKTPDLTNINNFAKILSDGISYYVFLPDGKKPLYLRNLQYAMNEYLKASTALIDLLSGDYYFNALTKELGEYRQKLVLQKFNGIKTPTDIFIIMLNITKTSMLIREALIRQYTLKK